MSCLTKGGGSLRRVICEYIFCHLCRNVIWRFYKVTFISRNIIKVNSRHNNTNATKGTIYVTWLNMRHCWILLFSQSTVQKQHFQIYPLKRLCSKALFLLDKKKCFSEMQSHKILRLFCNLVLTYILFCSKSSFLIVFILICVKAS